VAAALGPGRQGGLMRSGTNALYAEALPVLHEAAVLFAAGFVHDAIALMEKQIETSSLDRQAWLVLFDLYYAAGKKDAFGRLSTKYRADFPGYIARAWGAPVPVMSPGTLLLAGLVDQRCSLRLQEHAAGRRAFALDFAQVERIAFDFIGPFAGLLRTLHMQGKHVILANISEIHVVLLEAFGIERQVLLVRPKFTAPGSRDFAANEALSTPDAVAA
jgi:hypothetical protein